MYTNDWEDQAMSSLFHLICSLYKVGLSAYSYKALNDGRKKVFSYTLCVCVVPGRKASGLYWSHAETGQKLLLTEHLQT